MKRKQKRTLLILVSVAFAVALLLGALAVFQPFNGSTLTVASFPWSDGFESGFSAWDAVNGQASISSSVSHSGSNSLLCSASGQYVTVNLASSVSSIDVSFWVLFENSPAETHTYLFTLANSANPSDTILYFGVTYANIRLTIGDDNSPIGSASAYLPSALENNVWYNMRIVAVLGQSGSYKLYFNNVETISVSGDTGATALDTINIGEYNTGVNHNIYFDDVTISLISSPIPSPSSTPTPSSSPVPTPTLPSTSATPSPTTTPFNPESTPTPSPSSDASTPTPSSSYVGVSDQFSNPIIASIIEYKMYIIFAVLVLVSFIIVIVKWNKKG
jgi:hypothetical protein